MIALLVLVSLGSSAECERDFSWMRLIKSDIRSLMKDERLDSLMVFGIHRDRGSKLDLGAVVNRSKAKFPKCMIALPMAFVH